MSGLAIPDASAITVESVGTEIEAELDAEVDSHWLEKGRMPPGWVKEDDTDADDDDA